MRALPSRLIWSRPDASTSLVRLGCPYYDVNNTTRLTIRRPSSFSPRTTHPAPSRIVGTLREQEVPE
jgi:hypothetical protein